MEMIEWNPAVDEGLVIISVDDLDKRALQIA
jgi:hypothetical protein